jgi:threonylcarbamoyladenosine tRNA methylthiotransferase MtaB
MRALAHGAGLSDAVVVNSCAVTNEAVRQSRQAIRRARRANPQARLVVTGCAAQIDPAAFAQMPEVDIVLGNGAKLDPEQWRAIGESGGSPVRVNDIMSVRETAGHLVEGYGDRSRAFLEIQNGCDHRCTFCIIPYGRGNSRSTPISDVVEAARRLVDAGWREIVLTGVDITSYGDDLDGAPTLGTLVGEILDNIPGLHRLRLSSIDGAEVDAALLERITGDERLAPHLHLSLQSGDNLILKRMKRRHSRAEAIRFCSEVRAHRPEFAFGADLIAGFPTETEDMFGRSLDLVDEAGLQYVHVFPFSPREGTPAARMPQTPRPIVKARAARLREKARIALEAFLDRLVGARADAVIESGGRARLANFAAARMTAPAGEIGTVAAIDIIGRNGDTLIAAPATA